VTQGARVMLLHALENALSRHEHAGNDAKPTVGLFFTSYNDGDLLNFIETNGDENAKKLILNIRKSTICQCGIALHA